jgi:hypothetical protein
MKIFNRIWELLTVLGIYASFMFALGYLYASIPLVQERTCSPDFIDRVFK